MHIDIVQIGNRKVNRPTKENPYKNLHEYLLIAKKLICHIAPQLRPGLDRQILSNEDAVSNIATEIMFGDSRWNGTGTIKGYRKQCARWAIQKYLKREDHNRKHYTLSLNHMVNNNEFGNSIPDSGNNNPASIVEKDEEFDMQSRLMKNVFHSDILSNSQKKCITEYYFNNKTYDNIGEMLGISKQRIEQLINGGLKKLRQHCKNNYGDYYAEE